MINIKRATIEDLPFIYRLENDVFEANIRTSKRAIRNSINNHNQRVFVLEDNNIPCASVTLFIHVNSIRIYSIAVLREMQGKNYGKKLMEYIFSYVLEKYVSRITLEADLSNTRLIKWYQSLGFEIIKELPHYYGKDKPAYKMQKNMFDKNQKIKNIVVVDKPLDFLNNIDTIEIVTAKDYIVQEKYQKIKSVRIFNLCSSYAYQSIGYYVSLLASARQQRIIPNVATIKDFSDSVITESIAGDFSTLVQQTLSKIKEKEFTLEVYFGKNLIKKYDKLAKALYKLFESPLIRFVFKKNGQWSLKEATPFTMEEVDIEHSVIRELAIKYFSQKKFAISKFKNYKYSLAILVDPTEIVPPSCKRALKNFRIAAEKIGFFTEFITKEDYSRITEFDALFIRATTNPNNFTYLFSRYAYAEGLAVIDDPWSILKCANKIYFAETMKQQGIKTPKTAIIGKDMGYKSILNDLNFPIVLKEPDNAFGLGVFKVDNMKDLEMTLNRIFEKSEIVLAQEFIKSSFDWRVGILHHKPLYACKYHMVENHWQIEKWNNNRDDIVYGKHETFLVEQAPKEVLKVALKAAEIMGDGLYGVDLKEANGNIYVIEVNDNPSIDNGVEDKLLKGKLYHKIIYDLYSRLQIGSDKRYVSNEYKSKEK